MYEIPLHGTLRNIYMSRNIMANNTLKMKDSLIHIKFSEDEKRKRMDLAKQFGFSSLSAYTRFLYRFAEINFSPSPEVKKEASEYITFLLELGDVGFGLSKTTKKEKESWSSFLPHDQE